jgi:6-phosphofructokinase 2
VLTAGGLTGLRLCELLKTERLETHIVTVAGETREDFTVDETQSGRQFRFVLPGPRLTRVEIDSLDRAVASLQPAADLVLASGSLPVGVPAAWYGRLARQVRDAGGRMAIDASGPALRHALNAGVWLAKPNLNELEDHCGRALADDAARLQACRALVADGAAELVALSMGQQGAMLVSADGVWRAPAIPVQAVSTIGAGDSFTGAFLWAFALGRPMGEAFRWAMAAGAAALLAPGAQLCRAADVRRLLPQVAVHAC